MPESRHNIAHILPWPCVGGVERATLQTAQAMSSDEFNHIAFCLKGATPVREMFEAAGFETVEYEAAEPSYRHPKEYLRASWRLAGKFRSNKIDLVQCADLLAGYRTSLAASLARVPLVCHIRGRFEEVTRRDRSFLRGVKKFIFVSRNTWQTFGHKVSTRHGTVIYDGVDIVEVEDEEAKVSVRAEFGISDEAKIIGMVARVAPVKDYLTLIRAAARIKAVDPRVRFLVVGEHSGVEQYREHYEEVKEWLAEHDVARQFIFTDFREDVSRLIAALDIFVLSTHSEGLPLVIMEAMAQAKPVVATRVGGIPEIIKDGETGLLFSHQDDAQLAARLLSLLEDDRLARKIGEAGRLFVKANFSKERFSEEMARLYREMLRLNHLAADNVGKRRSLVEDV
jgi:glycosyltransferase involved in cell wall biosynthesis